MRTLALAVCTGIVAGCGSAPAPVTVVPTAPVAPVIVSLDKKIAWILRLEQQRVLRDAGVARPDGSAAAPAGRLIAPASTPDLEALALDTDPSVRRRAALAIGRVGSADGIPALVFALGDVEERVRGEAAFALGLIGTKDAVAPLQNALKDLSATARGRAIEGLGLVGPTLAGSAALAIAAASAGCKARLAALEADDESPQPAEVEACRLALFSLVRLRHYDALAAIALDENGGPVSRWWPVAYALQRSGDPRAAAALLTLAASPGIYTPAFALRGLATLKERQALPRAEAAAAHAASDVRLRVAGVRAVGQLGGPPQAALLIRLLDDPTTPRNLSLEIVAALGAIGDPRAFDSLLDRIADPWPAMRAEVLAAAAKVNPEGLLFVIASMAPDQDWSVRAALATLLKGLPPDRVRGTIQDLADDADARVRGPALESLAAIGSSDLARRLFDALDAPDFAVRATAAQLMGEKKLDGGASRLSSAYTRGESDATYAARLAAIEAIAKFGGEEAKATIRRALSDREWPVRLRAAELLQSLGETAARPELPAPLRQSVEFFESKALLHPAYSPHAFLETRRGTIEIELNVVESPVTVIQFIELARAGFYNGVKVHRVVPNFVLQVGDPRGDGEGGPGYSIRDELSPLPFVRGTVGMALGGRDTGGSQFFIAVSPQPHLDAKYTVFGRVVNGIELLDSISRWDVIERVRIWDGINQ